MEKGRVDMKFGCCTDIDNASVVHEAGYDFLECTVVSLVPENDSDYKEVLNKVKESPIPVEVCNVFLPGNIKIVGENADEEAIKNYLAKALPRVKEIGADTVVFGSGGARTIPEGFPRHQAEEQIEHFLHLAADHAESLGITIVIEPLNTKESNVINSVPEAVELAQRVNRPSIQALADFYHMEEENESLENIVDAKEYLKHVHVADSGRLAPGTGSYPYKEFAEALQRADYSKRVSIECKWNNFEEELTHSKKFLTEHLEKTKI